MHICMIISKMGKGEGRRMSESTISEAFKRDPLSPIVTLERYVFDNVINRLWKPRLCTVCD